MAPSFLQKLSRLELEEKILNGSLLCAIVGVFCPWLQGQASLVEDTMHVYNGLEYHTSYIGIAVLLLQVYILLITALPLVTGTPLLRKRYREIVRLCGTVISTILVLAALSVLLNVTFQAPGLEVRFGIYLTFIGSMIAAFYAFLALQEQQRDQVRELFHHPEDRSPPAEQQDLLSPVPPPPPPPPPPTAEGHPHRL